MVRLSLRLAVAAAAIGSLIGVANAQTPSPSDSHGAGASESQNATLTKPEEMADKLRHTMEANGLELNKIHDEIRAQITTVQQANTIFDRMVTAVSNISNSLSPDGPFVKDLERLQQLAEDRAKTYAGSSNAETRALASEFHDRALKFAEIKRDAIDKHNKGRIKVQEFNSNRESVIARIEIQAFDKAAEKAKEYIVLADKSLGIPEPLIKKDVKSTSGRRE
jgi:hypothetical protein